jgi:hypothetical protein
LTYQGRRDVGILNTGYLFKNIYILERMTGSVVLSEVYAVIYVVLSKAEKHLFYGDFVGTTGCLTL